MPTTEITPDVKPVGDDSVYSLALGHHLVSEVLDEAAFDVSDAAAAVQRVGVGSTEVAVVDPSDETVETLEGEGVTGSTTFIVYN